MTSLELVGMIALMSGILLLVIAWIVSRRKAAFYSKALQTEGIVAALIKRKSEESSASHSEEDEIIKTSEKITKGFLYAPRVEYHGPSGEKHIFESKTFSYPSKYNIGDKLVLYYDREHPEKGVIDSFMEKWMVVIILAILGAIIFLTGLIIQLPA
jgi:hypothetical protein